MDRKHVKLGMSFCEQYNRLASLLGNNDKLNELCAGQDSKHKRLTLLSLMTSSELGLRSSLRAHASPEARVRAHSGCMPSALCQMDVNSINDIKCV